MFPINPNHATDYYKTGHYAQYPAGTTRVYSNFTARSDRLAEMLPDFDHKACFGGLQGVSQWMLRDWWRDGFFNRPQAEVLRDHERRMATSLGAGLVGNDHIAGLHMLGYLPIRIKALPEGSRVNLRVPYFTVENTHDDFPWITNYIESSLSAAMWKSITNLTIAYEFRRLLDSYAKKTGSPLDFVQWQGHDFSMRGMSGVQDATMCGAMHLIPFTGTDTITAIDYLERFYGANSDLELIGGSVPATEHSVMCLGGDGGDELETFRRLATKLYPGGVVSIVSDTWDFWKVLTEFAVTLREEILNRTPNALGLAKVVFRPDSGDPVKIICGDPSAPIGSPARRGAVECLWDVFGGTETATGHRMLNPRVGLIYGDSITLDRARRIMEGLDRKKFASGNIVFGIGSYTYQMSTRDTLGHAYKATWAKVNGQAVELYKDPVTDSGTKRSARGLLRVEKEGDDFRLYDRQTREQEQCGALQTVFLDGEVTRTESLSTIRRRLLGA